MFCCSCLALFIYFLIIIPFNYKQLFFIKLLQFKGRNRLNTTHFIHAMACQFPMFVTRQKIIVVAAFSIVKLLLCKGIHFLVVMVYDDFLQVIHDSFVVIIGYK